MEEIEHEGANIINQNIVEVKKEPRKVRKVRSEDVDLMRTEPNNPLDSTIAPKTHGRSSEDDYMDQLLSKEDQVDQVPHVDFFF